MTARQPVASIHGRFQPFHLGHLEYALEAFKRYEHIYVGITQFRQRRLVQVEPGLAVHRAVPESNPLSYFERAVLIDSVLRNEGIEADRFEIVPFPIEDPTELPEFIGTGIPALTTTYDDWNLRKIELLRSVGYEVVNLWTRDRKQYVGSEVRDKLVAGDESWRSLVPGAVANLLDEWRIADRLRRLHGSDRVDPT